MIIVKLAGGLGNQMFQYAAAFALAQRHNADLLLDLSYLNNDPKGAYTKRQYELDVFHLPNRFATEEDLLPYFKNNDSKLKRLLQRKLPGIMKYNYISESGNKYHPGFAHYSQNTYLDGFWQSEKYFKEAESALRTVFVFKENLTGLNADVMEQIKNTNAVSIHVRRGDYVKNANVLAYHGVCEPEYYFNAVNILAGKERDLKLFIFSDDTEWCKKELRFDFPTTLVSNNNQKNNYIDMQLMSACKHNIIANSSFSWWAAWLNENKGKKVFAPQKWFRDIKNLSGDLLPEEWEKI